MSNIGTLHARYNGLNMDYDTGEHVLHLAIPKSHTAAVKQVADELKQREASNNMVQVDVKNITRKRSLNANSYCWVLCNEIAKKVGVTKEEVYRNNITDVGSYEPLPIRKDALDTFIRRWSGKGTGWVVEVIDDSKLEGFVKVHAHYGSSTYTVEEMTRLIDLLVQDAESVGVQVLSNHERLILLEDWGE